MLLRNALKLSALIGAIPAATASLTATPSKDVNILDEIDGKGFSRRIVRVSSNVPVTLNNYFGSGTFVAGAPLNGDQVKVLVTSNCDTSQTNIESKIDFDEASGTITANLDIAEGSGAAMPYLAPSSFDASWSLRDFWCEEQQFIPEPLSPDGCKVCMNPKTGVCDDSQANCFVDPCDIDGACNEGETCKPNYCGGCHAICSGGSTSTTAPTKPFASVDSKCAPNAACNVLGSTCAEGTESCCGETYNSMECECMDMRGDGKLQYLCLATDACMLPCEVTQPELPVLIQVPSTAVPEVIVKIDDDDSRCAPNAACNVLGSTCASGKESCCGETYNSMECECADMRGDGKLQYLCLATDACMLPCEVTQPELPVLIQVPSTAVPEVIVKIDDDDSRCAPNAACNVLGSTCASGKESCCGETYNSMECECADMRGDGKLQYLCLATEACFLPCEDGLEELPKVPSTAVPGAIAETSVSTTAATVAATTATTTESAQSSDDTRDTNSLGVDPNAAFTQQRCFAATFVVLVLATLLLPGRDNNMHGWMGFGTVVVAAATLSAVVPKRNIGNRNAVRTNGHTRALQDTCSFNVEILYDGCAQAISVDAPSARVVDVSLENYRSTDAGDCMRDYDVSLAFPVTDTTRELDLPDNNTVDALPEFGYQCAVVAIGRPFIDSSGEMLKAAPMVPDMNKFGSLASVSWSGEIGIDEEAISSKDNVTDSRFLLGEEWTERGLGEHASVASFSAFSIALMTNNAPSDLVEDALKAGMDEIRHARTSFEVASKLLGRSVAPGPLPPSSHEFGNDLTSLALAVAREGCVDETLSAIVADLEVEGIRRVLEEGSEEDMYSNIEHDTLRWIQNEMRTIATEESSHAALAWRTLNWVCETDSDACEAVHSDVFNESSLDMRFNQRAMSALNGIATVRSKLKDEWMALYEVHRLIQSESDISHTKKSICDESDSDLGDISAAVLRGMITC